MADFLQRRASESKVVIPPAGEEVTLQGEQNRAADNMSVPLLGDDSPSYLLSVTVVCEGNLTGITDDFTIEVDSKGMVEDLLPEISKTVHVPLNRLILRTSGGSGLPLSLSQSMWSAGIVFTPKVFCTRVSNWVYKRIRDSSQETVNKSVDGCEADGAASPYKQRCVGPEPRCLFSSAPDHGADVDVGDAEAPTVALVSELQLGVEASQEPSSSAAADVDNDVAASRGLSCSVVSVTADGDHAVAASKRLACSVDSAGASGADIEGDGLPTVTPLQGSCKCVHCMLLDSLSD